MDFLKFFGRGTAAPTASVPLPTGSFTIDRTGRIVSSTVSNYFPEKHALEIGRAIIETFRRAQTAEIVLTEVTLNFAAIKVTARELRGGAIIFFAPMNSTLKS